MEEKAEKYAFQVCRKPQEVSIDALFAVMERLDVRGKYVVSGYAVVL